MLLPNCCQMAVRDSFFGGAGSLADTRSVQIRQLDSVLEALDDFHDAYRRKHVLPERPAIRRGVAGDGLVNTFDDFRQDVGVEQGFIPRRSPSMALRDAASMARSRSWRR
jgi:hypothetical protein